MDISYIGASCFDINVNKTSFIINPVNKKVGPKNPKLDKAIVLLSGSQEALNHEDINAEFVVDGPGEYEIKGAAIRGIQTSAHTDIHDSDEMTNTIYTIRANDVALAFLGNPSSPVKEETLEHVGTIDVLLVPVGGNGYTLDAKNAAKVVKEIEPRIVIPYHYATSDVTYESPQDNVEAFIEELGSEPIREEKLKLKSSSLPENQELIVLK